MTTETTPALGTEQPKPVTPATAPPTSSEATEILQEMAIVGVTPGDTDKATLEQYLIPSGPPTQVVQQQTAGEFTSGAVEGAESIVSGAAGPGLQTDFTSPMVATTHSEDGRIYIYNKYTGERVPCNVNMLPSKLKNRVNDNADPNYGKLLWTVVDPGFRPKQGTYKCWLHKDGAWRELADGWNRPYCKKANIISEFDVIQHVKNTHKRDYLAIDEHRKEGERQEDRKVQQQMLATFVAIQEGRSPIEVADSDFPGKVTVGDVSDSKTPSASESSVADSRGGISLKTMEPEQPVDIWKDAHKKKPRVCPMEDCDWDTRAKSNKVARSVFGRHRKEKHLETLSPALN